MWASPMSRLRIAAHAASVCAFNPTRRLLEDPCGADGSHYISGLVYLAQYVLQHCRREPSKIKVRHAGRAAVGALLAALCLLREALYLQARGS